MTYFGPLPYPGQPGQPGQSGQSGQPAAARADGAGWEGGELHPFPAGVTTGVREAVTDATATWRHTLRRARRAEGPRGVALRYSVALRYLGYLLTIVVCSAIANAAYANTAWRLAGTLVLFSAALMSVTAALGAMFVPQKRVQIVEDYRHFLFQVSMLPATGIAVFQWVMRAYTANPAHQDNFLGLLSNTLPLMFAFTVFFPAIVFVKAVAGRRMLDRSQQDDQELLQTWTRQDRYMP